MNTKALLKKSSFYYSRHQEVIVTMIVSLPGVGLDAIAEYLTAGITPYLYRDFFYMALMILSFILFKKELIKRKDVFKIPVYVIIIGQMISVLFRIQNPEYSFEPYFLKTEIIFSLMMFGIGSLVHTRHIIILSSINILFIIACCFTVQNFPIIKLISYGLIVSSSTFMVFFSQNMLVKLYRNLKNANNIIKIKNEELNKMNLAKDQIFKIIGHDLKTPFHQVKSLIDLIDDTDDLDEKNQMKSLLKESADNGNKLLEDLLKWSTTHQKTSEVKLEKQNLSKIINQVFEFSNLKSKDKEIDLINSIPPTLQINMNSTMMETVIRNLISNAIKFSYRGSRIVIKSQKINEMIKVSVIDKGIGISKFRLNELLINQINESITGTENESGNGHGLNIVKELVEKQHGIFEIKSKEKEGTTVNLYFPYS